jgi:hypothetical protein
MEQQWKEFTTPDGRKYWNDGKTSVWTKPEGVWTEYTTPDGRKYWNDGKTSVWTKPDALKNDVTPTQPSPRATAP